MVRLNFIISIEHKSKSKDARINKEEQKKWKDKQLRAQSPYIRVEDLESNVEQSDDQQKEESGKDMPKKRPRPQSVQKASPPKKSIKKWDSRGKGGGVKMDYTT